MSSMNKPKAHKAHAPASKYTTLFFVNEVKGKFGTMKTLRAARSFLDKLAATSTGAEVANLLSNSFILIRDYKEPVASPNGKSMGVGQIVAAPRDAGAGAVNKARATRTGYGGVDGDNETPF